MMNKSYLKCEKCENRSMFEEKNKKTLAMFKEHKNVQLSITTLLVLFTPALINTDILIMRINRKRDYQPNNSSQNIRLYVEFARICKNNVYTLFSLSI